MMKATAAGWGSDLAAHSLSYKLAPYCQDIVLMQKLLGLSESLRPFLPAALAFAEAFP